jgi:hypothetical protein
MGELGAVRAADLGAGGGSGAMRGARENEMSQGIPVRVWGWGATTRSGTYRSNGRPRFSEVKI